MNQETMLAILNDDEAVYRALAPSMIGVPTLAEYEAMVEESDRTAFAEYKDDNPDDDIDFESWQDNRHDPGMWDD